jgi:hypothetical protein
MAKQIESLWHFQDTDVVHLGMVWSITAGCVLLGPSVQHKLCRRYATNTGIKSNSLRLCLKIDWNHHYVSIWELRCLSISARVRFLDGARDLSLLHSVQTGYGAMQPPTQRKQQDITMGLKWPVREADRSPPYNAEVKCNWAIPPLYHMSLLHNAQSVNSRNTFTFTMFVCAASIAGINEYLDVHKTGYAHQASYFVATNNRDLETLSVCNVLTQIPPEYLFLYHPLHECQPCRTFCL